MRRQEKLNKNLPRKPLIGITGCIFCGKSTVARIFSSFGAEIIDADKIAHSLLEVQTKTYKKIVSKFGLSIIKEDKSINRAKLGQIVFSSPKLLAELEKIVHPEIIRQIKYKAKNSKSRIVCVDAPLLFETGLYRLMDKVVVVKAKRSKILNRAKMKFGLSKEEIKQRASYQMPLSNKILLADFVIDNNNSLKETEKQVETVLKGLQLLN